MPIAIEIICWNSTGPSPASDGRADSWKDLPVFKKPGGSLGVSAGPDSWNSRVIGEVTAPAGMDTVTRPSAERSSTSSLPVITTPAGPRSKAPRTPAPSDDGLRGRTPGAIRPASNPPSRTRGKMAKIAKFESADVPVFWPRLAKRPGRLSCDGRGDLGSSIN